MEKIKRLDVYTEYVWYCTKSPNEYSGCANGIRIQNRLVYISHNLIVCDNGAVTVWNSWYAVWLIATPAVRQTFAKALNIYDKQFLFMSFLSIFSRSFT